MRFGYIAVFACGLALLAATQTSLQKAIQTEMVDGDLKSAIEQYKKLAQGKDRAVAAKALVRMGECYEKLGDAEARKAYERVVREFGDQKESETAARARLAAMGKLASGSNMRLVDKDGRISAPSPDGRFLLQYAENGDMDLRDLQTGQIRHIAKRRWYGAAISPDGRQIAFLRYTDKRRELRIVGADGSGERLLWPVDDDWYTGGAQWFPDSKRIMLPAYSEPPQAMERCRLNAISAVDGSVTTLWEGHHLSRPQLSPDGRAIVYMKHLSDSPTAQELWLLSLENRSDVRLFQGHSSMIFPLWTPDGNGIVYLSDRRTAGATLDLWLLRIAEGKAQGLPELLKTDLGPNGDGESAYTMPAGPITRDGTYYFHRSSGAISQLLTTKFDPDTGKAVGTPSFVSRQGGLSKKPSFSRDGRWLAYQCQNQNVAIQSVESGVERVVPMVPSPLRGFWGGAMIFPDGRSVLVGAVHPKDGPGIYRVDAASGAWSALRKSGAGDLNVWPNGMSPDGRTVYLNVLKRGSGNRNLNHLMARDIETGQERELMEGGGMFALSHDGKQLAVAHSDGKDLTIEVLPASGGPRREIYRVPGFQEAAMTWTPDGRYLIFGPSDQPGNSQAYFRLPAEGGEAQPIGIAVSQDGQVQFPRALGAINIHPNGRQLVYVANGPLTTGEIWALENFLPKPAK